MTSWITKLSFKSNKKDSSHTVCEITQIHQLLHVEPEHRSNRGCGELLFVAVQLGKDSIYMGKLSPFDIVVSHIIGVLDTLKHDTFWLIQSLENLWGNIIIFYFNE